MTWPGVTDIVVVYALVLFEWAEGAIFFFSGSADRHFLCHLKYPGGARALRNVRERIDRTRVSLCCRSFSKKAPVSFGNTSSSSIAARAAALPFFPCAYSSGYPARLRIRTPVAI
jgi:hypothetical protein